jgi:flotillin
VDLSNEQIGLIVGGVIVIVAIISILGSLYRKVGPNRALIVYGRGGTRVVVGGGTVVTPLFQRADEFNLELMNFDVAPNYSLYTNQGIPVTVEAITQLKVENEEDKILRAANQFLSKREEDRETMVRQVMEGHLRGIVGQLTVEALVKDPEMVSARMRDTVAADLDKLGLEVVSFTLKDVSDESGYIENMSRPEIAHNKQVAEIAEAEALRNVAMRQADTLRESAEAQAKADQARVLAQSISKTAQSEAQRDLDIKQAQYTATVSEQKAQADRAYDIQASITQQKLVEEQSRVQIITKQQEVKIQEAEGARKAAELIATVQRQAEAENERIRILAEAERRRTIIAAEAAAQRKKVEAEASATAIRAEAEANADAIKMRGEADADALRARGLAEAESLKARGLAEAEALQRKIDVLNGQNQAAILDKALSGLPAIAASMADAYGKIGSVTYIGTGDGDSLTSRVGRDIAGMVPLMTSMFEQTTGLNLREMIAGKDISNGHDGYITADPDGAPPAVSSMASASIQRDEPVPVATQTDAVTNGQVPHAVEESGS